MVTAVRKIQLSATESHSVLNSAGMKSGNIVLAAGEHIVKSTDEREELLVILAGEGRAMMEQVPYYWPISFSAGAAVYIPPHTRHSIHNTGSGVLHYVHVKALRGTEGKNNE